MNKDKYLTVYDYGKGGVWQYIYALSKAEIIKKYPKLDILDQEPDWLNADRREKIRTYDIDDEPGDFLKELSKGAEKD